MKKLFNFILLYLALSLVNPFNNILTVKAVASEKDNITNANIDEVVEVFNHGQQSLYVTREDIDLMAKLIYAESRGEPFEGKVAVASVVLNRVLNSHFPNSIRGVIFQPNAFSCVRNNQIIANPDQNCYNAVYEALRGNDPTNEALYFYNPSTATCTWMKKTEKVDPKVIGHHLFFKN